MALENVGLGGVLSFDEKQAVSGMRSAGSVAERFQSQFGGIVGVAQQVGGAVGKMGQVMGGLSIAALPASVAFGAGVKSAADFEQQMSAVQAVAGLTAQQLSQLTLEAKKQGATTAFSATEAGKGFELLALGGFTFEEQMAAIGPVLSAAAADGIELAQSADIISNTLKALDLPATDAARAADVLALTSAKTSTDILSMGEAMKYAAPQAKTMGIDLETTAAMLGLVADAGLRGSLGGTSFTQALVKLADPSKEGAALIEELGIKFTKTADGGLDVIDVFKQVHEKTKGIPDVMERARVVTELFGVRGQKAFTAMQTAIESGKTDALVQELRNAEGAAKKMAGTRLDNFWGQIEMLKGAVEGFAIETAGLFLGPFRDSVKEYADTLSNIVVVLQELNSEQGLTDATADKTGSTVVAIAKGIKEGIDTIIGAWKTFRTEVADMIKSFTGDQSPEMIQQFSKIATIIFIVTAAIAPILGALGGVALFITTVVIPAFGAIGTIIGTIFSAPVLAAIAVVVGGFMLIRREGESVTDTFMRIVDGIVDGFNFALDNAIMPFIEGFSYFSDVFEWVWEQILVFVDDVRSIFSDLIGGIMQAAQALAPFFRVLFTFIGNIVGAVFSGIGVVVVWFLDIVKEVMTEVKHLILSVVESWVNFIKGIAYGVGYVADAIGLSWGAAVKEFGEGDFRIQVGTERGLGKPEQRIFEASTEKMATQAFPVNEANNEALASAVGGAVAANMPKEINVESKVCVDGKTVAKATAKHKQEISERAGFKATPWQRRALVEQGAAPVGGA